MEKENQLTVIDQGNVMRKPRPSPRNTGKLNAATAFNPNTTGIEVAKEGASTTPKGIKESTTQWVNRAFRVHNVTTNQSYQEILFQSLDTSVIPEQGDLNDRVNFVWRYTME